MQRPSMTGIAWARPAESPAPQAVPQPTKSNPADKFDINAGWPPRRLDMTDVRTVNAVSTSRDFTLDDRRTSIKAPLAHPDVTSLEGRWEILACNLVCEKSTREV